MSTYKNILKALNESTSTFKVGDRIKVKKEYCEDERDEAATYQIIELRGDRVLVELENSEETIVPTFVFKNEWIEKVKE